MNSRTDVVFVAVLYRARRLLAAAGGVCTDVAAAAAAMHT